MKQNAQSRSSRRRGGGHGMTTGRMVVTSAELFQYVHCVGEKQLNKLILHYKSNEVEARVHARTKKLPANSLSFDDNQHIVTFISNYADTHAIILPGRTPHHWVTEARLLPTNCTKGQVHRQYEESLKQTTYRIASESERTFRRVWEQLMPFVTTMKPASDLCFTCQKGSAKVARSANMPGESKSAAIREMEEHLLHVTKERSYLRSVLDSAKSDLPEEAQLGRHGTCSFNGLAHYSFDFAQQVQYPSNPLQPGPIYFKVPIKCGLFGIQCEALTQQVNFLIDEAVTCGKGASCVISLLHFFLESYGLGETHLHLHADNCSGQNKNSAMLWYLLWRVMTGRHIDIKLSFLITGHTKFSPDGGFGLIKCRYRRTAVNCLADLADVVTQSSTMNMVQLCGNDAGDVFVPTCDWTAHLPQYFRKLVGIKGFQHFQFRNDGSISAQRIVGTTPVIFNLLKSTIVLPLQDTVATTIQPSGLDLTRQWYLFDEIHQFVEESCQDLVAPKPNQTKASASNAAAMDVYEPTEPPPAKVRKGKEKGKGKTSS